MSLRTDKLINRKEIKEELRLIDNNTILFSNDYRKDIYKRNFIKNNRVE